jgi:hypothetical protein
LQLSGKPFHLFSHTGEQLNHCLFPLLKGGVNVFLCGQSYVHASNTTLNLLCLKSYRLLPE